MARSLAYKLRNGMRRAGYEIVAVSGQKNLLALHVSELFAQRGVNCVFDVGAREGEYGLWLRRNGYRGRIVSFEPVASNARVLAARAADDAQWDVHVSALGAENGSATINVTELTHFSSFRSPSTLSRETFGDESAVTRTETVRVQRLDTVFDAAVSGLRDPSVYLKMDTQGWDLEVLKGATASRTKIVALQSEVSVRAFYQESPTMIDSFEQIRQYGFVPSGMFPVHVSAGLELSEFDYVAVRLRE